MGLTLSEAVVAEVIAFLTAELPAQLLAVQTDAGDGLVLAPVLEWIRGERMPVDWPSGWVFVGQATPDIEENRDSHDGFFPSGLWNHEVEVVVGITDPDDPDRLRTRLYRYVRAIHELFRLHESYAPGTADWIRARVLAHHYSRLFRHVDQTEFRQDAHVLVRVWRAD